MRWLVVAGVGAVLSVGGGLRAASRDEASSARIPATSAPIHAAVPIVKGIVFVGLRHLAPAAVEAQITSHAGQELDARRIESDVKALGRLGWFDDIRVETRPMPELASPSLGDERSYVQLVFVVEERPFLTKVDFGGSKLLSAGQIAKILADQKLTPKLGEPAAPEALTRVSNTIRRALAELAHPQADVQLQRQVLENGTVRIRFVIDDGPHIPVGRIKLEEDPRVPAKTLKHEMRRTAPGALFASWRGRSAFTREGFEEDRARVLTYYRDHGFPEASLGAAQTSLYEKPAPRWLLWARGKANQRFLVTVPVEAGPFYRVDSIAVGPELAAAAGKQKAKLLAVSKRQAGNPYSANTSEELRRAWAAAVEPKHQLDATKQTRGVEAVRAFDARSNAARITFDFSDGPPYAVRRIEFLGLHRFSDRYLRRRIGLQEGRPFDEHALEAGLGRLAKTGYFHQIKKEDIRVQTDDVSHIADVTIRVSEAGQQRVSFSGGQGQLGSTLGVAYSLFDVLQLEELLSTHVDVGPQSLQLALGLLMEGFLGSRSSLAFSVFNDVLRPRLTTSVKGPFYSSESEGLSANWGYALTNTDSVGVTYTLATTRTTYALALPTSLAGSPVSSVHADTASSAVGLGWVRDTGEERMSVANSVSGGWLGGNENVVRSNEEYAHIIADPFAHGRNAWAVRTTFSGAGSYWGDMPLYSRLFSGDTQVRGLRPGELGPYAVVPQANTTSGAQTYTALPAGANVITAANVEYRVPLGDGVQGAGFFDLGSGWMLPNWLGPTRPALLGATNGVLHGSVGFELRWTVPGIGVPVRAYCAVNVIRLDRFLPLPDGTLFHAHNRLFAFGWALGRLF